MKKATIKACVFGLGLCVSAGTARAQTMASDANSPMTNTPTYGNPILPTQTSRAAPTGMRVGEGSILHAGAGLEVGYDSNVFYSSRGPRGSALVVALPYVELTNAPAAGAPAPSTYYSLSANLQYRQYLDSLASDRASGLSAAANALAEFGSNQQLSFTIANSFIRSLEAPYVAVDADSATAVNEPIKHWADLLSLRLKWAPGGGRLVAILQQSAALDIYEKDESAAFSYSKANAYGFLTALDVSWKWLPKTAIYGRATWGQNIYFASMSGKNNSFPLHLFAGIRGLLTAKLSLNLAVGYANGFYSGGAGPGGLRGNLAALAEIGWSLQGTTGFILGYRHDFENSLIGNFYYSDSIYASLNQMIAQRVSITLGSKVDFRTYQGLGVGVGAGAGGRSDTSIQAGGTIDYFVQTYFYFGVGGGYFHNKTNSTTDASSMQGQAATAPLDYDKYQVFARLGVTY